MVEHQEKHLNEYFKYQEDDKSFMIKEILCVGAGYVGTLSMTIFAYQYPGIKISIFDKNEQLIQKWRNSKTDSLPIIEPKFRKYFEQVYNRNLFFCSELNSNLEEFDLIFICVNTPSSSSYKISLKDSLNGLNQLSHDINRGIQISTDNVTDSFDFIIKKIAESKISLNKQRIFIQKSTVPIYTLKKLNSRIKDVLNGKVEDNNIDDFIRRNYLLLNIPEFLAEGSAMNNLLQPDRVIIGALLNKKADNEYAKFSVNVMKTFFNKWIPEDRIIDLDSNSSEIVKLLSNAFLAQRISSINSITEFCELTSSNINKISVAVGKDSRIGCNYLKASMGFGGSCLKKDLLSLIYLLQSQNLEIQANYWSQVLLINEYQKLRICANILNSITTSKVAVFGLSFKGNINDVRSANSVFLTNYIVYNNIHVNLYDPLVKFQDFLNEMRYSSESFSESIEVEQIDKNITFYEDFRECLKGCNTLVLCNDHTIFKTLFKPSQLYELMDSPQYIFDCYDNFPSEEYKSTDFNSFKLGEHTDLLKLREDMEN